MNKIIFLYLSIILTNLKCYLNTQLNGICGYPGKPYKASLEPDNKLVYSEGEEVTYQCKDYWFHVQTRKCEKGQWTGKPARCADFVKDVLLNYAKIEDISTPEKPITILELENVTLTAPTWKYPHSFAETRIKTSLRVFGTKRYKWTFKFDKPIVKLFVKINMNFINYTQLTNEEKKNFTFHVSLDVSPERKCSIDFQNEEKWYNNGGKINTFFSCDSLSPEALQRDIKNPGDYLIMETKANVELYHYLLAIIFGQTYGSQKEPICGEPELSVSHSSRFKQQHRNYVIECKSDKNYKVTDSESRLICIGDMKWSGSYPKCLPLKPCPVDKLLVNPDSNLTLIDNLAKLYFYNNSDYYAIEGSHVQYVCLNPNNDILVGNDNRVCLKNGSWSNTEPYCYDPNIRKFPLLMIVLILVGVITAVIILIALIFSVYTKKFKKRITKQIVNQNKDKLNAYDDIEPYMGANDCYNHYEDVNYQEDSGVHYADPHYSEGQDYAQLTQQTQIQAQVESVDNRESNYVLNSFPTPLPRMSLKPTEPNIYYN